MTVHGQRERSRRPWLQFGHGGEPWMTELTGEQIAGTTKLQFGHGGEPWMTCSVRTAAT